ncbi:MAG TPA: hypothetical protein VFM38_03670 [Candidatus Limnocylindrales bacterium]|nr:hypothetical protein [Candidatus Limnocylindrales bacterium]
MSHRDDTPFTCVTCEIEIAGPVTFYVGLPFCCAGCVANGPCTCSYDEVTDEASTPADAVSVRHCLDIETAGAKDAFDRSADEALATRH